MKTMYNQLPSGQANAMRIDDISEMWGMTNRRARKIIERMWHNNLPVCNLFNGYFRPSTVEELKSYLNIINAYKREFMKKEYRVKRCIEAFGQLSFSNKP